MKHCSVPSLAGDLNNLGLLIFSSTTVTPSSNSDICQHNIVEVVMYDSQGYLWTGQSPWLDVEHLSTSEGALGRTEG